MIFKSQFLFQVQVDEYLWTILRCNAFISPGRKTLKTAYINMISFLQASGFTLISNFYSART